MREPSNEEIAAASEYLRSAGIVFAFEESGHVLRDQSEEIAAILRSAFATHTEGQQ